MKYHALVGETHVEVTVQREGGGFRVSIDGETHHVDIGVLRDGHAYSLIVDDRSVDVGVEEDGNRVTLLIEGGRYDTEVLGEREWLARSIQAASPEGERIVRANMTGIVRDVLVAPGDPVHRGQTLFILEAMKMENEVKAGIDGTVRAVGVEPGATVSVGDLVIEIE